jgi:hypothetical protein
MGHPNWLYHLPFLLEKKDGDKMKCMVDDIGHLTYEA